jgi:hypothetical protein
VSLDQLERTKTQAVSCRPLTSETRVRAGVTPCEICGGQSDTGTGSSQSSSVSSPNIIPAWLFMLIYYLGDEQ